MARKKIKFSEGDIFCVPSQDGSFYIGQVASDSRSEIGAIFCFFFRNKISSIDDAKSILLESFEVVSAILVTPEMIEYGHWPV